MTHPLGINYTRNEFLNWCKDIWAVASGRWSLHRAWQRGHDDHIEMESARRARGGR
jgi:hypothetical protein